MSAFKRIGLSMFAAALGTYAADFGWWLSGGSSHAPLLMGVVGSLIVINAVYNEFFADK